MKQIAALLTAVCVLAMPPLAGASTHPPIPSLSLDRADRAAAKEVRVTVQEANEGWDEYLESCEDPEQALDCWDNTDPNWYVVSYALAPCERVSRTRASCDAVYSLNTGEECDATYVVRTNRRNRVSVRNLGWDCEAETL